MVCGTMGEMVSQINRLVMRRFVPWFKTLKLILKDLMNFCHVDVSLKY